MSKTTPDTEQFAPISGEPDRCENCHQPSMDHVNGRCRKHFCERCGERLNPQTMVWLELNLRTGLYADPEQTPVPESESQGAFTFGQACAKAVLANGGENKHIMKAKTRRGP